MRLQLVGWSMRPLAGKIQLFGIGKRRIKLTSIDGPLVESEEEVEAWLQSFRPPHQPFSEAYTRVFRLFQQENGFVLPEDMGGL